MPTLPMPPQPLPTVGRVPLRAPDEAAVLADRVHQDLDGAPHQSLRKALADTLLQRHQFVAAVLPHGCRDLWGIHGRRMEVGVCECAA